MFDRAGLNGRSPGADLFSHYFEESQGLDPSVVGGVFVSQTRETMSFPQNGPEDIGAMDFALGVLSFAPVPGPELIFGEPGEFYFSLTPTSALDLNQAAGNFTAGRPAHPADIYVIVWDETQQPGAWSSPVLYKAWEALDLGAEDNVDALAVDPTRGTLAYSTQLAAPRSQLILHYSINGDPYSGTNSTLMSQPPATGGNPPPAPAEVVRIVGTDGTTDIDAISFLDPKEWTNSVLFGTPTCWLQFQGLSEPMGLSVTRSFTLDDTNSENDVSSTGLVHLQLSGRRGTQDMPTVVQFFMTTGYTAMGPGAPGCTPSNVWGTDTWVEGGEPIIRVESG
ncbi:MAG: hypothetical protein L3J32_07200, partial [Rhizobiaceae bacterium]|nr:hypothetical protein [Rhizobiaceae bacterium]